MFSFFFFFNLERHFKRYGWHQLGRRWRKQKWTLYFAISFHWINSYLNGCRTKTIKASFVYDSDVAAASSWSHATPPSTAPQTRNIREHIYGCATNQSMNKTVLIKHSTFGDGLMWRGIASPTICTVHGMYKHCWHISRDSVTIMVRVPDNYALHTSRMCGRRMAEPTPTQRWTREIMLLSVCLSMSIAARRHETQLPYTIDVSFWNQPVAIMLFVRPFISWHKYDAIRALWRKKNTVENKRKLENWKTEIARFN